MKNIKNIYCLAMMSFLLATIFTHHALTMEEELTEQDYRDFLPGYQTNPRYDALTIEDYIRDAKLLRRYGFDINRVNQFTNNQRYPTFLHMAACVGNIQAIPILLRAGAQNFNVQNYHGQTPLHIAAFYNNISAVKALLQVNGIDVNILDRGGHTPLSLVVFNREGALSIVEMLLTAGADINRQDRILLYPAVRDARIVQALLNAGADIDIQDYQGKTPLYVAAVDGYVDSVRVLLQAGANINIPNNAGQTAEQVATNPEVLALLAEYRQANIDRVHTVMQASELQNQRLPNVASHIHSYL